MRAVPAVQLWYTLPVSAIVSGKFRVSLDGSDGGQTNEKLMSEGGDDRSAPLEAFARSSRYGAKYSESSTARLSLCRVIAAPWCVQEVGSLKGGQVYLPAVYTVSKPQLRGASDFSSLEKNAPDLDVPTVLCRSRLCWALRWNRHFFPLCTGHHAPSIAAPARKSPRFHVFRRRTYVLVS